MTTKIGFVVDRAGRAVNAYARLASHIPYVLERREDFTWRNFYAWVLSYGEKPLRVITVCDMWCVRWLDYMRHRFDLRVIGLELDRPVAWDFDAKYTALDLGWGVDKVHWGYVGENRIWRREPVFYLTEWDQGTADAIQSRGFRAVTGNKAYAMGNVAIVPSKRLVPHDIYEAMATGMAVATVSDNAAWMGDIPSIQARLDTDGVGAVVDEVLGSDYKFLGMMAKEVVPSEQTFRQRIRSLLTCQ